MTTRLDIRTRARIHADQDGSTFPTNTQYDLLIDAAAKEAWYDLIQGGWPPPTEVVTVTLTGADSYDLGTPRTMASFDYGASTMQVFFIDDGTDPSLKNGYLVDIINHLGPPKVVITIDDGAKTITVDYSSNASPVPTIADLKAAVIAAGLSPVGPDWDLVGTVNITPDPNFATTAGGTAGSDPIFAVRETLWINGGSARDLPRVREEDRAALETATGTPRAYEVESTATGVKLRVFPTSATGTVKTRVVREFPGFAGDASRWYGPARSDELVVLRAAARGLRKEGDQQGAAVLDGEYQRLLERVINMASWVDQRNVGLIRDVTTRRPRDPFDLDVAGPDGNY